MAHRIIVSGIYRSGTSLITALTHRWGAYAGQESDIFQDEYGYMEHMALQKLNDELLENNSRVPTPVDILLEKAQHPVLRERALQILDTMDKEMKEHGAIAWVWKDPRLPLVLPFWANIWGDVLYVIPVRHPVETILSAAKMEGLEPENVPLSAGFAYWQFCMLNVLTFTEASQRKLFMLYDQLLQDPVTECRRLCDFLNQHCGVVPQDAQQQANQMAAQVTSKQHHFKEPRPLAEVQVTTREQRALFNFLRLKTLYPHESFQPDDFALYPGWSEYLQTIDILVSLQNGETHLPNEVSSHPPDRAG